MAALDPVTSLRARQPHRASGHARYRDIDQYGLIGDCRTAALVGPDGSIDWLCLPRFDSPSVFARILDHDSGGYWHLGPAGSPSEGVMRYRPETALLETRHEASGDSLLVVDAMLLHIHDDDAAPVVVRTVKVVSGEFVVESALAARPGYATSQPRIELVDDGAELETAEMPLHLRIFGAPRPAEAVVESGILHHRLRLAAHEQATFALTLGDTPAANVLERVDRTEREWVSYCRRCRISGPHAGIVKRSSITLKLLTYTPTGAIVAAPTTSLPEEIGGERNWDYRYTWLRDASMTAYALLSLEQHAEAVDFVNWACMRVMDTADLADLRIMYRVDGSPDIPESELSHLAGYRGSRPVRIGNAAVHQLQLDIYGQVLDCVLQLVGHDPHADFAARDILQHAWPQFRRIADHVARNWHRPDSGIWEMRTAPRHFVHSKVMSWVALDRATKLSRQFALDGPIAEWQNIADTIHTQVLTHGFNQERGGFRQAYGDDHLDAANLRISLLKFLPVDDPRVLANIDATLRELTTDGLVYRYRHTDDGLHGDEGTFALCSFWLVSALAHAGRTRQAHVLFEQMLTHAGPLGLYGEQIAPDTKTTLGNYPQAFTHLGLITSAIHLERESAKEDTSPTATPGSQDAGYQ